MYLFQGNIVREFSALQHALKRFHQILMVVHYKLVKITHGFSVL